jgi:hypothetical protein
MLCQTLSFKGSHTRSLRLCPLLEHAWRLIVGPGRLMRADASLGWCCHWHAPSYDGWLLNIIWISFIFILAVVHRMNGLLRLILVANRRIPLPSRTSLGSDAARFHGHSCLGTFGSCHHSRPRTLSGLQGLVTQYLSILI